uniref:Cytochrome P450 n=1 Tax=Steinernema glaseri TaxID=37863 RepID=A0A1I7ZZ64_9BILA
MLFFLAVLCVLSAAYYLNLLWRSAYFKRLGLPYPKPSSLFLGSVAELQQDLQPQEKMFQWEKELGDTYGIIEGGHKTIVTSDLSILQDVFVKKFECFHGRKLPLPMAIDPETSPLNNDVFGSQGLRWKRLRAISNPSFTTSKLKALEPMIQDSVHRFIDICKSNENTLYNIHPLYNRLAMDIIQRVAFGRTESHLYGNEPEPIIKIAQKSFNPDPIATNKIAAFFTGTYDFLPVTKHLFSFLRQLTGDAFPALRERLGDVVAERRRLLAAGEEPPMDFIQMFLDAQADASELEKLTREMHGELDRGAVKVSRKMTEEEIKGQCTAFLLAGYDTTANSLAYLTYHLATNPRVQERLYDEIMAVCPNDEDVHLESVNKIAYLDMCVKEALRLNPLGATVCSRKCVKTCRVGERGLLVEKGVNIRSNVLSVHTDPKTWGENAEEFDPQRFNPLNEEAAKRHPIAFQAFGSGPRTCIGMRFALLEEKIAIVQLLRNFFIDRTEETKLVRKGLIIMTPEDVKVVLRPRLVD